MGVRYRQPLQPRYGGGQPQLWGVRQLGPQNGNQWESQQLNGQYGTQSMGRPGPHYMTHQGPYSLPQPRSQFIGQPTPQHTGHHQISHTMGGQPRSSPISILGGQGMSEDHTDMNGALVQLQQGHVYTQTAWNHCTQEPLTASMLAGADEKVQKQMLGESLYPLIHRLLPDNTHVVGKITGMVLEIDNSELLHMLEDETSLKAKVDEALAVLEAHPSQEIQQ